VSILGNKKFLARCLRTCHLYVANKLRRNLWSWSCGKV